MILSLMLACSGTANDTHNATRQPFPLGHLHLCADQDSAEMHWVNINKEAQLVQGIGIGTATELCWDRLLGPPRGLSPALTLKHRLAQANHCDVYDDVSACLTLGSGYLSGTGLPRLPQRAGDLWGRTCLRLQDRLSHTIWDGQTKSEVAELTLLCAAAVAFHQGPHGDPKLSTVLKPLAEKLLAETAEGTLANVDLGVRLSWFALLAENPELVLHTLNGAKFEGDTRFALTNKIPALAMSGKLAEAKELLLEHEELVVRERYSFETEISTPVTLLEEQLDDFAIYWSMIQEHPQLKALAVYAFELAQRPLPTPEPKPTAEQLAVLHPDSAIWLDPGPERPASFTENDLSAARLLRQQSAQSIEQAGQCPADLSWTEAGERCSSQALKQALDAVARARKMQAEFPSGLALAYAGLGRTYLQLHYPTSARVAFDLALEQWQALPTAMGTIELQEGIILADLLLQDTADLRRSTQQLVQRPLLDLVISDDPRLRPAERPSLLSFLSANGQASIRPLRALEWAHPHPQDAELVYTQLLRWEQHTLDRDSMDLHPLAVTARPFAPGQPLSTDQALQLEQWKRLLALRSKQDPSAAVPSPAALCAALPVGTVLVDYRQVAVDSSHQPSLVAATAVLAQARDTRVDSPAASWTPQDLLVLDSRSYAVGLHKADPAIRQPIQLVKQQLDGLRQQRLDAFVLRAGQCDSVHRVALGPVTPLLYLVQQHLRLWDQANSPEYGNLATLLSELLWQPIQHLASSETTFVVPNGLTAGVAFSTLPVAGTPLSEHTELVYFRRANDLSTVSLQQLVPMLTSGEVTGLQADHYHLAPKLGRELDFGYFTRAIAETLHAAE